MDEREFETNINQFLIIWDDYINFLSVQPFELEIFIGVIDRIKMKQSICIEQNGVTVGLKDTDIQIMPEELEYINKLKTLLKGSKVIITKGDLKIEVE